MGRLSHALPPLHAVTALIALTAAAVLVEPTFGQCATQWLPGPAFAGTSHPAHATVEWDPDGAGPQGRLIVAGGDFLAAGNVAANCIAAFDPITQSWQPLGSGMNGTVRALAVLTGGELVAAGAFTFAGGSPANRIARWNGTSWSPFGSGLSDHATALAVLPNGDLVAGGMFMTAGGSPAHHVARWNGTAWSALGSGVNLTVHALAVLPNGELVAGGAFSSAGGTPANKVAKWNGSSWAPIGAFPGLLVRTLRVLTNGNLVVGGLGTPFGVSAGVWQATGSSWSTLGSFPGLSIDALAVLQNGNVVAGGQTDAVRQWNGVSWASLGTFGPSVTSLLTLQNGDLIATGAFNRVASVFVDGIARWTGTAWSRLGPVSAGPALTNGLTAMPNGDVVCGAIFTDTQTRFVVLRWTDTVATQVGGDFNSTITTTIRMPNGDIVASGYFWIAGGTAASCIARWNGASWSALGTGLDFPAFALAVLPNGDLVAAGDFHFAGGVPVNRVARWDGVAWSPLGTGLSGSIKALAVMPNGDLVAGGASGGAANVARWSGVSWTPLGTMTGGVAALAVLPNGDIVAAGELTQASGFFVNGIARWNGTNWSPLGDGLSGPVQPTVTALVALPNGDVVASGPFDQAGGLPANGIARWDGASWSALATRPTGASPGASTMCLLPNGDLAVGGDPIVMDGVVAARLARLSTTCPALATTAGQGCVGSGGLNALAATTLPWLGATYRAAASGMPANALALDVYGATTAAIPLPTILPQGVAGCSLLTSPDILKVLVPVAGAASTTLALPNTTSLAGFVIHQQVVALDLGTTGSLVAVTSSNRLTLTIGAF